MTLSITGSPVLIGNNDIGHIEFFPTDMDAVDSSDNPTGKKLLVARTLHTNESRNRINGHLLVRGLTHGSMAMHEDGTAYVVRRGNEGGSHRVRRTPVLETHHDMGTVISVKHSIRFVPDSSSVLADPDFATHPAVLMTWYEGASHAAAIEDAHRAATGQDVLVRMMRYAEYRRFVTWDDKYTKKQVKERAHLHRRGVKGTASVTGDAAALRTTDEGFVDVFGNVYIWIDDVDKRPAMGADMDTVARIVEGETWKTSPRNACVFNYNFYNPEDISGSDSVRWVAVIR